MHASSRTCLRTSECALAQLQAELADVTRETAWLLLDPEYEEEKLWDLDQRARELHARIRSVALAGAGHHPHQRVRRPVAAPSRSPAAEYRIELTAPRRTAPDYEAFVTGLCTIPPGPDQDQCVRCITRRMLGLYARLGMTPPPGRRDFAASIAVTTDSPEDRTPP